jgi:hypothetical protein
MGHKTWVYGYNQDTKQQSSPHPMKARQVWSNIKSILIIFLAMRILLIKNLFLWTKQLTAQLLEGFAMS